MDFSSNQSSGADSFFVSLYSMGESFLHSPVFLVIKIFLMVYVIILVVNIILMLAMKGVGGDFRKGLRGMDIPLTSKSKMQKQWEKVLERLKTGNMSQYKVAIIEADAIADKLLAGIGYEGANMSERLAQIRPEQLDYYTDELNRVHQIRNRVVHEADFEVSRELAEETIAVYERFLRYLEFL